MSDRGTIAKFLREKGEGIHHLAVTVDDVSRAIEEAKKKGLRVLDEVPRKGARGHPRRIRASKVNARSTVRILRPLGLHSAALTSDLTDHRRSVEIPFHDLSWSLADKKIEDD